MKAQLRLLLATDYSGHVKSAEQYAVHLTGSKNTLQILHVFSPPLEGALSCFEPKEPQTYAKEYLENHIRQLLDDLNEKMHGNCTGIARENTNIGECIIDEAEAFDADLIIMGTHGAGKLNEVLLGSHTWDVIRKSNIPVLAIPSGSEFNNIKRFVFVTECRESEIPAIQLLSTIAREMKAELIILHIADNEMRIASGSMNPQVFFDELKTKVNLDLKTDLIFHDRLADGLNRYCKRSRPNWLVVSSERLALFDKIFKSEAKDLHKSTISHIPLLIIPDYGYLISRLASGKVVPSS